MMVNPRKRKKRTRRKNPVARVTRRRSKKYATKRRASSRRRNPVVAVRRTRRRRNPIGGNMVNGMVANLKTAAIEAAGGIALDAIWGNAPIPEMLKDGAMKYAAKIAIAAAVGMVGEKVLKGNKPAVNSFVRGMLVTTLYQAGRSAVQTALPNLTLGDASHDMMTGIYDVPLAGMGLTLHGAGDNTYDTSDASQHYY